MHCAMDLHPCGWVQPSKACYCHNEGVTAESIISSASGIFYVLMSFKSPDPLDMAKVHSTVQPLGGRVVLTIGISVSEGRRCGLL